MEIEWVPLGQSLADKHRAAELRWRGKPAGIPPDMAIEFMAKLKAGSTVRKLTGGGRLGPAIVSFNRFKKHCDLYPEWGSEAWRISKINSSVGKGAALRLTTHCRAGLHPLTEANILIDGTHGRRRCLACRRVRATHAPIMSIEVAEKVREALRNGANLKQITTGKPTGGGRIDSGLIITTRSIIQRHRRENPDFNDAVTATMGSRVAPLAAAGTYPYHWNESDLHAVRDLLPDGFPGKDDVVQSIFLALLEGRIGRDQLRAYLRRFVNNYYRLHPTRYAKVGNSLLVSLDAVLFDRGSTTRADTVSRGLWD